MIQKNKESDTYESNRLLKKPVLKYDYSRSTILENQKSDDLTLSDITNLKSPNRLKRPRNGNNETVPDQCWSCDKNLKNQAFYHKKLRILEEKYKKLRRKYVLCASKRSNLSYWKKAKKRSESNITIESFIDGIEDVR